MALRVVLVGLVIGLGCDLPSGDQVSGWLRVGGAWVQARIDGLIGPEVAAEEDPPADAEFAGIVDAMAQDFSADLAATERPKSRETLTFEPFDVPDDLETGAAFALNRESQGEGIAAPADEVEAPALPAESRASHLASAVRLTGQAAAAWWTVIRGAGTTALVR
jgi:hypothetical protein